MHVITTRGAHSAASLAAVLGGGVEVSAAEATLEDVFLILTGEGVAA